MKRVRNIVFSILCLVVLCSTGAALLAGTLGVDLSCVRARSDSGQMALEGRPSTTLSEVRAASAVDGSKQECFERYLSDRFPLHEDALLANAALQRGQIRVANVLAGYGAYPTFLGSDYVYWPEADAVLTLPWTDETVFVDNIDFVAANINALAATTDAEVHCYMVDIGGTTDANPLTDQISGRISLAEVSSDFDAALDVSLTTMACANAEEYRARYLKSDHHWSLAGAYEGYRVMAEGLGIEPVVADAPVTVAATRFVGCSARPGLDVRVADTAYDCAVINREAGLTVSSPDLVYTRFDGSPYDHDDRAEIRDGTADPLELYWDCYHLYCGKNDNYVIDNLADDSGRNLLIVQDSFGAALDEMLACSYDKVYVFDPSNAWSTIPSTLDVFLQAHVVDDIVFVGSARTYCAPVWGRFLAFVPES